MAGAVKQYLWKQKIHRGLVKHVNKWKILIDGEQWLCPYCGEIGFKQISNRSLADQILDHFSNECKAWDEGKGEQKLPGVLKERANKLTLRSRLMRKPSWRLYDFDARWYCPYCAQPTDISRTVGNKISEDMVQRVSKHLKTCPLAKRPAPKEIAIEKLNATVQECNRLRGLVVTLRTQLEKGNELWIQCDLNRIWICPYCVQVVEDVRMEDTEVLISVAPPLMAQHLVKRCESFKENSQLERELTEFKSMVQEIREGKRSGGTVKELKENLADTKAKLETASSELDRAREVQRAILPEKMPQIEKYEIECTYQPAAQLGGDFYSFIEVDESHLGFLVADVSGHGADAALIMTMTKKAFDLRGPQNTSSGHVLQIINHDVHTDLRGNHFVTAFYGILDTEKNTINFSRAGHNYPLLYNADRSPSIAILKSKGMAIGVGTNDIFEKNMDERELQLEAGDILLIYTDGLVEAKDNSGEDFELPRVCDVLMTFGQGSLKELLKALMDTVSEFLDGEPQEDDIALMAIRYTG